MDFIKYSKYIIPSLIILFFLIIQVPTELYGEFPISIVDQKIFKDLNGDWNLVGVIQNNAGTPIEVKIGVNITKPNNVSSILTSNTFTNVIYPYTAAPLNLLLAVTNYLRDWPILLRQKK